MLGEHEVPEFGHTADREEMQNRLPRPMTRISPASAVLRGEAEPFFDGKKRIEDALAPAEGLAAAVLIATLLWALIALIVERISLVAQLGDGARKVPCLELVVRLL